MKTKFGVVLRTASSTQKLEGDIALKLRVANGTHTAIAHTLALSKLLQTNVLCSNDDKSSTTTTTGSGHNKHKHKKHNVLMEYLDALFETQILEGASTTYGRQETMDVYQDWRARLTHPHFGLSSFFITQNGAAKGGIRLSPTIKSLFQDNHHTTVSMAFAYAALLRFLTPIEVKSKSASGSGSDSKDGVVYRGWLDGHGRRDTIKEADGGDAEGADTDNNSNNDSSNNAVVVYADGMRHNVQQGWYEFKCPCKIQIQTSTDGSSNNTETVMLAEALASLDSRSRSSAPTSVENNVIRAYLRSSHDGGAMADLQERTDCPNVHQVQKELELDGLVSAIATLYARMVAGNTCLEILQEMSSKQGIFATEGFNTKTTTGTNTPTIFKLPI